MEKEKVATSTKTTGSRVNTRTGSSKEATRTAALKTKAARATHTNRTEITKARTGKTTTVATGTIAPITATKRATMGLLLLGATDELSTTRSTTAVAAAAKTKGNRVDAGTKSPLLGGKMLCGQARPKGRNC